MRGQRVTAKTRSRKPSVTQKTCHNSAWRSCHRAHLFRCGTVQRAIDADRSDESPRNAPSGPSHDLATGFAHTEPPVVTVVANSSLPSLTLKELLLGHAGARTQETTRRLCKCEITQTQLSHDNCGESWP